MRAVFGIQVYLSNTCNYQCFIVCFNVLKVLQPDILIWVAIYFYTHRQF